jgi:antitoxin component of MazEF toxin-antitoxin module
MYIVLFKYIPWISIVYGKKKIRLKLRRVGNSLMIAIPSQVVKDLKLKAGDDMLLDIIDSTISVKKERK